MRTATIHCAMIIALSTTLNAAEFHVALSGNDANAGSQAASLRTIQRAAELAQPGDVITVHEGVYRERINPPRGGESDARRIVYQAAPGEKVEITGSEAVQGWTKVQNDTWKVTLPNSFFGKFNPYSEVIHGDWFAPKGRQHHTGAVYLHGQWLIEAAKLDDVLLPVGDSAVTTGQAGGEYLLNVAWLRPVGGAGNAPRIPATGFAVKQGTQNAPCSEGGDCIGFIEHGHFVRYDRVDFGQKTQQIEIRAASASQGGVIEIRLDGEKGELLGSCPVPNTGGWQSWSSFKPKIKPISGVTNLCLVFKNAKLDGAGAQLWFAKIDDQNTTIWAQFPGVNPNEQAVEINVRPTVFYPDKPGRNFITVRGFTMRNAATNWAPPTAEQVGLIGTHWSKGWIIENNDVSHSVCCGIALGKHGDQFDNTSADTAEGYVKTIERAHSHAIPWTKEHIGGHIVRNNHVSYCEQAGIVGSLGCSFSTVTGNTIHDIHVRQLFTGAEMAGIKFHGAIDCEISGNHIYRTCRGLWLDWMAQGTRVSANLFHENQSEDLFVEVDHGPFLVDNNIFLSPTTVLDVSEGGAYVHNLISGRMVVSPELNRDTPFHKPHSTELAGLVNIKGGDDRFYNNIVTGPGGLTAYDNVKFPVAMGGNLFLKQAKPCKQETDALVKPDCDPAFRLVEKPDGFYLETAFDKAWAEDARPRKLVTTELLGKAKIPNLPYEQADGSPIRITKDYLGAARAEANPFPGPLEASAYGKQEIKVWPNAGR